MKRVKMKGRVSYRKHCVCDFCEKERTRNAHKARSLLTVKHSVNELALFSLSLPLFSDTLSFLFSSK